MLGYETETLDQKDQMTIICDTCGATLLEYRRGVKCSADLDYPCPGFRWVERVVSQNSDAK